MANNVPSKSFFFQVVPSQKLAVMYVMDSILKNVTGVGNYKEHIEKMVHRVFLHVFETVCYFSFFFSFLSGVVLRS